MSFSREAFAVGSDTVLTGFFKDGILRELVLECSNIDQERSITSWVSDKSVGVITSATYFQYALSFF